MNFSILDGVSLAGCSAAMISLLFIWRRLRMAYRTVNADTFAAQAEAGDWPDDDYNCSQTAEYAERTYWYFEEVEVIHEALGEYGLLREYEQSLVVASVATELSSIRYSSVFVHQRPELEQAFAARLDAPDQLDRQVCEHESSREASCWEPSRESYFWVINAQNPEPNK